MTSAKTRVSVAVLANNLEINGISTVIMNYYPRINKDRFDITIIAGEKVDPNYKRICDTNGINLIELPNRRKKTVIFYRELFKYLIKAHFDIIHIHCNSAMVTPELCLAWISGIKIRIAHCHSSTCSDPKTNKLLFPLFKRLYTNGLACSQLAGEWLFTDRGFEICKNGFAVENYRFSQQDRDKIRKELNIENQYVIGHIGRFNNSKNQPFLLKVFEDVAKINPQATLLLVGDGPDREQVTELINKHPFKDRIINYGETINAPALYSAMDVFAFPSKHEGLGLVAVEAQISGLKCIASTNVPQEITIAGQTKYIPLTKKDDWVAILADSKNIRENRTLFFDAHKDDIYTYDIQKCVHWLESYYTSLLN